MALVVKNLSANTENLKDAGSIPGLERSPDSLWVLRNQSISSYWQFYRHRVIKNIFINPLIISIDFNVPTHSLCLIHVMSFFIVYFLKVISTLYNLQSISFLLDCLSFFFLSFGDFYSVFSSFCLIWIYFTMTFRIYCGENLIYWLKMLC